MNYINLSIIFLCFYLHITLIISFQLNPLSISNFHKKSHSFQIQALKYDPIDYITVTVKKPLGISLEEIVPNEKKGVYVVDIKDGNIKSLKVIRKGYHLIEVNDMDVRQMDFDTVMNILIDIDNEKDMKLTFIDSNDIYKGKANIRVKLPNGDEKLVTCLKGQTLRNVLMDNNVEVYSSTSKFTNCNGGGQCATCTVRVMNNEFWEPRAEFEAKKLKKYDEFARLSCNTVVEGDCVVDIQPKKTI